tara:strand:- start:193 stop:651 length:459 start_codon:yes stop_codon:yes gene_type:complete
MAHASEVDTQAGEPIQDVRGSEHEGAAAPIEGIDFDEASTAWRANKRRKVGMEGMFEYVDATGLPVECEAYAQCATNKLFYKVKVRFDSKRKAVEMHWAHPFQSDELCMGSVLKLVSSAALARGVLQSTKQVAEFRCTRWKALKRFQLRIAN